MNVKHPKAWAWTLLAAALLALPAAAIAESYTMTEGDTLWELARVRYGDPAFYRDLQRANEITDTNSIPIGTVIQLPSKEALLELRGVTDPAERQRILEQDRQGSSTRTPPRRGPTSFEPAAGLASRVSVPTVGATTAP